MARQESFLYELLKQYTKLSLMSENSRTLSYKDGVNVSAAVKKRALLFFFIPLYIFLYIFFKHFSLAYL